MRRALNEIYSMCQKAAEGAGAPAGLDSDAAHGVVWLLGHGLAALGGLLDTLEQIPQQPHRCRFDTWLPASADTLDADGKAGALIAPGLIDLLVAASGRQAGRLTLLSLSMPLYLLPRAAQYARDGLSFHFAVLDPGGNRFVLEVLPEGEVTLWGPAGNRGERLLTADTSFAVAAVCAQSLAALPAAGTGGLDVMMDKTSLAAAYTTALADGIDIEPALWQRLQSLAARVLVPASAQSRLRGAGAQISDQD